MENRTIFEVSWQTLWRVFIFGSIFYLFYLAREAVGVLAVAIVISLGLEPIVRFLQKRRIPRLLGALIVFIVGLLVFAVVIYFIVPIIISEIGGFLEHFNQSFTNFFGIGLPQAVIQDLTSSLGKIFGFLNAANISIGGAIGVIITRTVLFLATIIISFYLLVEKGGSERLIGVLVPDLYERSVMRIFQNFKIKIRRWLLAQIGLSFVIGVVVSIGLWLLGVRYFLILGLMAAAFEIVPIIGPVLAGATAFLVAVSDSFSLGLYVLLFFFIVQQLENHILIPIIIGKSMKIHPVIVLSSLLAGGKIAGFVGIILAVPIAVIVQEVFDYLAERKDKKSALGI